MRLRKYWKEVIQSRRRLNLGSLTDPPSNDLRPYASINLLGQQVSGLIDTGASISVAAAELASSLCNQHPSKLKRISSKLSTADGTNHDIKGKITTQITFRGRSELMDIYIIPTLSQNLYLGVDFVRKFHLAADLFTDTPLTPTISGILLKQTS